MCRMLARVTSSPESCGYEFIDAPHSLFQQSKCARYNSGPSSCGPHPSGCGYALVQDGIVSVDRRGMEDRWDDSFKAALKEARAEFALGHNRKASPGLRVDKSCSHPYRLDIDGTVVALCHNGGIYSFEAEAIERGVSDSQILLENLVADKKCPSAESLKLKLKKLAQTAQFDSLTAFLLTPKSIYGWRILNERHENAENNSNYYTLYMSKTKDKIVIASEPLDGSDWSEIKNNTFFTLTREANNSCNIECETV